MRWLEKLRMRLQMLLHRGREGERLDAELQFHLEQQAAEGVAAGMSAEEARCAALRSFGNPTVLRAQARETWSWGSMDTLLRDVKIGLRTLARTPGFALTALAVMVLCLGATISLFTVVRAVLLKPLPFADPDHLTMVYEHFRNYSFDSGYNYNPVSPADFRDWRAQTHGFEDMAAWSGRDFNLNGEHGELPEVVSAAGGSWNLFSLLGVRPVLGRTFAENEDRPDSNVAMLTWSLFERRFGGDASIIGRQIHLDGKPWTVVGVLPQWFNYPDARVQLWVPFQAGLPPAILEHHDFHFAHVVARLRPGVSVGDAMSQVEAVQYRLHLQNLDKPVAEDAVPRPMLDDMVHDVRKPLVILLCAVGCVLLIGCLNVANLLVARGAARQKETAIRGALGANRMALIREQMIESVLICVAGGAGGLLLSLGLTRWLATGWKALPRATSIHPDGMVIGFTCAAIFAAAALAGLVPAISSTRRASFEALHDGSRSVSGSLARTSLRRTLLTVEIAVTVALLICAGLLLRSYLRLRTTDVGADTDHVLTLQFSLASSQYKDKAKAVSFEEALLERVRHLPGVRAAGLGMVVPGGGYGGDDVFTIAEHPPIQPGKPLPDAIYRSADPGYFRALRIPLLQGRTFADYERLDRSHYVVISQQLARQYFPGENPIGQHMSVAFDDPTPRTYEIIGVVGDTLWQVGKPNRATMYFPVFSGNTQNGFALAVRTAGDPLAMALPVQKVIGSLDPGLPVSEVLTMDQVLGRSTQSASFSATLVLAFAALSLLLAAVGLFGVLSYMVTQRTREIGVRIALGAEREHVLRLMLFDGLRPALLGLALGLAVSVGVTRLLASVLFGTKPLDPAVFVLVSGTLLVVAAAACLLPAVRASRLDPMQALRIE